MRVVFLPIFVADTKVIFSYNFLAWMYFMITLQDVIYNNFTGFYPGTFIDVHLSRQSTTLNCGLLADCFPVNDKQK